MAESKDQVRPVPPAGSFAETLRKPEKIFALLARGGGFVKIPLRFMNANERAAIDAKYPDPFPPRKFNAAGQPYLDIYDEKHRRGCADAEMQRLKARIALLLPDEFMGTSDAEEKIRLVWENWSEADIFALDRQGANPYETREEGVQAKEEQISPFDRTSGAVS